MKCIILCAGYATRLYPLTENQPKPLLMVGGRPVLEHILDRLLPMREIDEIFIVTNAKFCNHFKEWLKEFKRKNLPKKNIEVVDDRTTSNDDRLGSLGDLLFVLKQKSIKEDVLVVAGDNLFTGDLKGFIAMCKVDGSPAIGLYDVKDINEAKKFGIVLTKGDKVVDFEEKPAQPKSTLASMAIYFCPKSTFGPLEKFVSISEKPDLGFFIKWIFKTVPVKGYVFEGKWFDIGSFESLKKADEELRAG